MQGNGAAAVEQCAGTFCDWNEGTDRVEIAHDDHPTVELDMPALIGTTYSLPGSCS